MDIFTLGVIILVVLTAAMILVKIFFKSIFKIISLIWLVIFIAGVVLGLLVYADMADMKGKCPDMPPAFVLDDSGELRAGFVLNLEGEPGFVADFGDFSAARESGDFDALLKEKHCKIIFVNISVLENISEVEFTEDFSLPGEVIIRTVRAEVPADELAGYIMEEGRKGKQIKGFTTGVFTPMAKSTLVTEIRDQIGRGNELKGALFGLAFARSIETMGPSFLFDNYKSGEMEVFEETIMFKTVKYFPSSLFNSMAEKAMQIQQVNQNGTSG